VVTLKAPQLSFSSRPVRAARLCKRVKGAAGAAAAGTAGLPLKRPRQIRAQLAGRPTPASTGGRSSRAPRACALPRIRAPAPGRPDARVAREASVRRRRSGRLALRRQGSRQVRGAEIAKVLAREMCAFRSAPSARKSSGPPPRVRRRVFVALDAYRLISTRQYGHASENLHAAATFCGLI
jgi:hypothetical protein